MNPEHDSTLDAISQLALGLKSKPRPARQDGLGPTFIGNKLRNWGPLVDRLWYANKIAREAPDELEHLRLYYPDMKLGHYTSLCSATVGERGRLDSAMLEEHPEWQLLPWWPNNSKWEGRVILDVCDDKFQGWAMHHLLDRVAGVWDGVAKFDFGALDNLIIGEDGLAELDRWKPDWKYSHDHDRWNSGFMQYVDRVRRTLNVNGYGLVCNHTLPCNAREWRLWRTLLESMKGKDNGLMSERCISHDGKAYSDEDWMQALDRHDEIIEAGLADWWVTYPKTAEEFLYAYCSWLMVYQPGLSFFTADTRHWNGVDGFWQAEYGYALGAPAQARQQLEGMWKRSYEHGVVVVNPATTKFFDARVVNQVVRLAPGTARIVWS